MAIAIGLLIASTFALAARYLRGGFKAWLPRWIDRRIRKATAKLPPDQRIRLDEEWRSHINDVDGKIEKIYVAAGLNIAAKRLRSHDRHKLGREASYNLSAASHNFQFRLAECCQTPKNEQLVVVVDLIGVNQRETDITLLCATIHYSGCVNHRQLSHRSIPFPSRTAAERAILHPPPARSDVDWLV